MKTSVVITTIHSPTRAVQGYAARPALDVIVVGDRKTPSSWALPGTRFLSSDEQVSAPGHLAHVLPWNHYCRKMLGYVEASRRGADVIVDTDDDNTPDDGWDFPPFDGEFATTRAGAGWVNVFSLFSDDPVWPRGLPLDRVTAPEARLSRTALQHQASRVGVWQGLVNGDPDVDAIYRLTVGLPCSFAAAPPVVLAAGTLSPFNSQNTAFRPEVFPLLYLPTTVTFRFTDILRSLVAQPLLWAHGFSLGISRPTVTQDRNPHDLMADFRSELPCYLEAPRVPEIVAGALRGGRSIPDDLTDAYEALERATIVSGEELKVLEAWLRDLEACR